jgi:hypothetical protein
VISACDENKARIYTETTELKEIVTNAGVGYLTVEHSIMISLKATRSLPLAE